MKNYQKRGDDRGGFRGDRGDRDTKPSFKPAFKSRGADRGGDREVSLFKATCSECSKTCEVPFRPTGDKPVYCRDCFAGKRGQEERGARPSSTSYEPKRFSNSDRSAPRTDSARQEFKAAPTLSNDDTKKQLAEISSKLDKLVQAIERMSLPKKDAVTPHQQETPAKAVVQIEKPTVKKVIVAPKKVADKKVEKKAAVKKTAVKKVVLKKVTAKTPAKKSK